MERAFSKWRKRDKFLNFAVGNQPNYTFTIFDEPAISTVSEDWNLKFQHEGNRVRRVLTVPGISLKDLIANFGNDKRLDLINIDIEGADFDALRSIDFETLPRDRYPKWLLLETSPPVGLALELPAVKYAVGYGYVPWMVLPMGTLLKTSDF